MQHASRREEATVVCRHRRRRAGGVVGSASFLAWTQVHRELSEAMRAVKEHLIGILLALGTKFPRYGGARERIEFPEMGC